MAAALRLIIIIACTLLLVSCSTPWGSSSRGSIPTPNSERPPTVATATEESIPTPNATQSAQAAPIPAPPTAISASPESVTPIASPTPPPITKTRVAQCCGVFSWIDAQRLLVFDNPAQGQAGAWVIDVSSGSRQFVAPNFGIASATGLIAFPDRTTGRTEIRRLDSLVVSSIDNGGVLTWISPDGTRVAWLEDLGVEQTSSLVHRTVRLWSAEIDGSNPRSLLEFTASAIQWLPDSQHVIALGRAPNGARPGIWVVDTSTGANGVVVDGAFLQALRLSPEGSRMAYLETFSGDSSQDGVWIANTNGSERVHLRETGSFRWAGDASHLWFLELAPRDGANDSLIKIDVTGDSVAERIDLGGRVLNDEWEVSPDGAFVAYWSEADQSVMVRRLTR